MSFYTTIYKLKDIFWDMKPCGKNSERSESYHLEDGDDMLLRNVGSNESHTTLYPTKTYFIVVAAKYITEDRILRSYTFYMLLPLKVSLHRTKCFDHHGNHQVL
jgi:hypothetical protein